MMGALLPQASRTLGGPAISGAMGQVRAQHSRERASAQSHLLSEVTPLDSALVGPLNSLGAHGVQEH